MYALSLGIMDLAGPAVDTISLMVVKSGLRTRASMATKRPRGLEKNHSTPSAMTEDLDIFQKRLEDLEQSLKVMSELLSTSKEIAQIDLDLATQTYISTMV